MLVIKKKKNLAIFLISVVLVFWVLTKVIEYRTVKVSDVLNSTIDFSEFDKVTVDVIDLSKIDGDDYKDTVEVDNNEAIKEFLEYIGDLEMKKTKYPLISPKSLRIRLNFESSSNVLPTSLRIIGEDYLEIRVWVNKNTAYKFVDKKPDLDEVLEILQVEFEY